MPLPYTPDRELNPPNEWWGEDDLDDEEEFIELDEDFEEDYDDLDEDIRI